MRSKVCGIASEALAGALAARIYAKTPSQVRWICQQCRSNSTIRKSSAYNFAETLWERNGAGPVSNRYHVVRSFSSSSHRREGVADSKSKAKHELPSSQESRRSTASKQLSHLMDNIQANVFVAGQRLNDLTGYSAIEALKKEIDFQENLVQRTREQLQEAKENYTQAINQRSQSQREVNELLQRKNAWSPQDLERFTALYRSDHANEQAETEAQAAVTAAEHAAEEAAAKLNANILARYHEEQIWSDKIRRMSTWGTWGLMGVNVLLFLIFQIGVEPWRRKRLVKGFEEKVLEALEKETAAQRTIAAAAVAATTSARSTMSEEVSFDPMPVQSPAAGRDPEVIETTGLDIKQPFDQEPVLLQKGTTIEGWGSLVQQYHSKILQLFNAQPIQVRQVDLTTRFIEGALSSAVLISLLAAMFRGR